MNSSVIRYILGWVLKIEAILLLLPTLVAIIYKESAGFFYLLVSGLCLLTGFLMSMRKPKNFLFYLKEEFHRF